MLGYPRIVPAFLYEFLPIFFEKIKKNFGKNSIDQTFWDF
jgi:hypothetical protein